MNLLTQLLAQGLGSQGQAKPRTQGAGAPARPQSPGVQITDSRPFKMYEDRSFQGDPRQFIQQNPGYQFYEDGSFAPPQAMQYPRVNPETGYRSMAPGEESIDLARGPQGNLTAYREPGITSIGGKLGQYGGTVGMDNGQVFANMNRQGQPTDPLAELRRFLGL